MPAQISAVPPFSSLQDSLRTAYFFDCYTIELPLDTRSPLELYLSLVSNPPAWIDFLMYVRNKIVAQLGLKDMGPFNGAGRGTPAHGYCIGDQTGIFKLLELHEREVILGETDKHLDVKISLVKQDKADRTTVSVSTVVHVQNALGRLYMLLVAPAHRIIAPTMISKLAPQPA